MARKFKVIFPVLAYSEVRVEFTPDIDKSLKAHRITSDASVENDEACTIFFDDKNVVFIFFRLHPTFGTIAHESWHAIRRLMEWAGIAIDSETVAYHLGYLVDKIVAGRRKR